MKKKVFTLLCTCSLLMLSSQSQAWKVEVKNVLFQDIKVHVYGEHVIDHPVDCTVVVPRVAAGKGVSSGTCQMPGAICPVKILVHISFSGTGEDASYSYFYDHELKAACCKNSEVITYSDQGVGKVRWDCIPQ